MEEDYKIIDHYLMIRLPEEIDHHSCSVICRRADHHDVGQQRQPHRV